MARKPLTPWLSHLILRYPERWGRMKAISFVVPAAALLLCVACSETQEASRCADAANIVNMCRTNPEPDS